MTVTNSKIIFYHIPKTGGKWVKDAMLRSGIGFRKVNNRGNRKGLRFYQEFNLVSGHSCPRITTNRDKLGKFSFCFVRHPLAWYRSFWCFRVLNSGRYNPLFPPDKAICLDYEEYIKGILKIYPGFLTKMFQYYMGKDLRLVDCIGRQENLQSDLIKILDKSKIEYDKKKIRGKKYYNSSYRKQKNSLIINGKTLREFCVLSKKTKQRLLESEKWILDNFYNE